MCAFAWLFDCAFVLVVCVFAFYVFVCLCVFVFVWCCACLLVCLQVVCLFSDMSVRVLV